LRRRWAAREEDGELGGELGVGGVEGLAEFEELLAVGSAASGVATRVTMARVVGTPVKSVPGSAAMRFRPALWRRLRALVRVLGWLCSWGDSFSG
jgi:hypothetical protein